MIDDTWRSQVRPTLEDFVDMFVVPGARQSEGFNAADNEMILVVGRSRRTDVFRRVA